MSNKHKHPAFPQPHSAASLWRYLDCDKFEWLIDNRRLFMPSAKVFSDQKEGRPPDGQMHWWRALEEKAKSEEERRTVQQNRAKIIKFSEAFRTHYYVSCWHMNEAENMDMWKNYTNSADAVAVVTSYQALRIELPSYVEIGMVRYIDYSRDSLPSLNMFEYITHKDTRFEKEIEVRAVAAPPILEELGASHFQANHFESETEKGLLVFAPEVDTARLIERVVLHPESSPDFARKVSSACDRAGLPQPYASVFTAY